jgi:anti-sigma B factor antagonist
MHESLDTNGVATHEPLTVTFCDVSQGIILGVVAGEVDLLTGAILREKLTGAISGVPGHLVIDLSAVRFLASIGLNVLVEILAAQEAANRHLALVVNDNRAVTHPLQTTGLDQVFDIHPEVSTAVDACSASTGAEEHRFPQLDRSGADASAPIIGR